MPIAETAVWGIGGLFLRTLIKAGGDKATDATRGLSTLLQGALTDALAEDGPSALKELISALRLPGTATRGISEEYSIVDLAGLAWSQCLSTTDLNTLDRTFRDKDSRKLVRQLTPAWFVDTMLNSQALTELDIAGDIKNGALSEHSIEKLSKALSAATANTLELDPPIDDSAIRAILSRLPAQIEKIINSIPHAVNQLTRSAAEGALYHASGRASRDQLNTALRKLAKQLAASQDQDVFGRDIASAGEPPLLTLRDTYVEPQAFWRPVNAKSIIADKGDAISLLRRGISQKTGLCIIHAPFGFGKSLTFKMLASCLAQEWIDSPETASYPLLIRCPDLLAGRVATLESAIQAKLTRETGLLPTAVEHIWQRERVTVLLDGFDEVQLPERDAHDWIKEMQAVAKTGRVRIVLASRPHAFRDAWLEAGDVRIELVQFDEHRAQEWLNRNSHTILGRQLNYGQIAAKLDRDDVGIPIILLMAVHGWTKEDAAPQNKADIYRSFVQKISKGKWADVQAPHSVVQSGADRLQSSYGATAFQKALEILAWRALCIEQSRSGPSESNSLSRKEVESILELHFPDLKSEDVDAVTHSLCLSLFLHKGTKNETIVFSHRSFREYLAAQHLASAMLADPTIPIGSACWRLLTEAVVGQQEIAFLLQILDSADQAAVKEAIARLDYWSDNAGIILTSQRSGFRFEMTDLAQQVVQSHIRLDQGAILRSNSEVIARKFRRVNADWYDRATRPDGGPRSWRNNIPNWRVIEPIRFAHQGELTHACVYNKQTGTIGFASNKESIKSYKDIIEHESHLFLPIVDESEQHFVTSAPGATRRNPANYYQEDVLSRLPELVEVAHQLDHADIFFARAMMDSLVRTASGLRFGMYIPGPVSAANWLRRFILVRLAPMLCNEGQVDALHEPLTRLFSHLVKNGKNIDFIELDSIARELVELAYEQADDPEALTFD